MPERTFSPRLSVVALAASLIVMGGCQREPASSPGPAPATETPTPVVTVAPAPVLDRAGLLQAMDIAASAFATGQEVGGTSLAGRRFVIRQAFGCGDPAASAGEKTAEPGLANVSWDEARQSLKLSLNPADWSKSALIADDAEAWEAAEGFWLARPWLRVEGCPAVQSDPSVQDQPTAQTVGLAAVFNEGGSRTGRRNGRAYEFILRGEGDRPPVASANGYRLVLEGRMTAFADGHAIRCRASDPNRRPVCVGAVQLDRVAFEDAEGKMLSEWRGG